MSILKIKVRLKPNITKEEFFEATFYDSDFRMGSSFDIDKMKTEPLEGTKGKNGLVINIPLLDDEYVKLEYGRENIDIWDYEVIK